VGLRYQKAGDMDHAALSLSKLAVPEVLAVRTSVIEKARPCLRWVVPQAFTSADHTSAAQSS